MHRRATEWLRAGTMLPVLCGMTGARIRDYRDLHAWQKAMELAVLCDSLCDRLPRSASHLALQIRRSANSVHANIAEGNGRMSRADYLRHLSIAHGSLRELESHLHFARRRFGMTEFDEALSLATICGKLLTRLIASLRPRVGN